MEQPTSQRNIWPILAAATVVIIILAALRWSLAHPFGIDWDESEYLNWVSVDLARLYHGNLLRLGGRILVGSDGIPPAYRVLALPFLAVFGFHTTVARLASLAGFGLSCWFIYLAARRVSGNVAAAFAVLIFSLSPEVVSASMFFGTDAPVYLATSAMLYFLFVHWTEPSERPATWIGLGLAVALGFWAKASFFAIGLPVLAFALFVDLRKHRTLSGIKSVFKAGVLAGVVAAPWWLLNIRAAVSYAKYARGFVRNSLGPPSLATWGRWLNTVAQSLLGHGVSILIALVLLVFLWKAFVKKEKILDELQMNAIGACACAGLPIVLAQLSGTNYLLRHITPAVIPLAITVGVLAVQTGWTRSWAPLAASFVLFFVQLLMIVSPVVRPNQVALEPGFVNGSLPWRVLIRFDQWDWNPLYDMASTCGMETPTISFVGGGRALDPPHIEVPWVRDVASGRITPAQLPSPNWLWRYEDGSIDWQKVMDAADHSDIVITAPGYVGEVSNKEDLDNEHNVEFADRLSHDPLFQPPLHMKMGRFAPVDVQVYFKAALACRLQKDPRFGIPGPQTRKLETGMVMRGF